MTHARWEILEERRYLSASLDPATKLLTVTGTTKNDYIRVVIANVNLQVMMNGTTKSFPLKKVGSILIDALAGNDNVDIWNNILLPSTIRGGDGKDTLGGGGGNDDIDGGAGADDISGGPGIDAVDYSLRTNDVTVGIGGNADDGEAGEHDNVHFDIEQIIGGSGNDRLSGSGTSNTLWGNGGNDTLLGGMGNDAFFGGDGLDWVDYSDHDAQATLSGAAVNINIDDTADSGLMKNSQQVEFDNIHSDVENITGSAGADFILALGNVDNTIDARGGDDFITPTDGNDTVDGGAGNDSILGGAGDDMLIGGPDSISGSQTDQDFLAGEDGNDSIVGGADNDTVIGAAGNDSVSGGEGDDQIFGEVDADSLAGDGGNDTISGGIGDDTIDGGAGVDSLSGDDDNDMITDNGTIIPDDSDASASALDRPAPLDPDAIDTLDGGSGNDTITGGDGQAFLLGGDGNDTIVGGAGNEAIEAGLGNDVVFGGAGDDTIDGGFGADQLSGDDGNDIFVNADGQPDAIDGGDGIDLLQFEPALVDESANTEGQYDQPDPSFGPGLGAPLSSDIVPLANPPVPYSISDGILTIVGAVDANNNPVDDDMSLNQSGTTITLVDNGTTYPISAVGLKGILVDAGGGNDFVGLAQSNGKSTINLSATLLGGAGDDVLRGGNGNDSLSGGAGDDALSGNAGSDVINGGIDAPGLDSDGRDTMSGGPGNDSVRYDGRSTPLFLSLDGVANDGAAGEKDLIGSDIENVFGGRGNDSITGDGHANFLTGGKGADTIRGGAGNDKLVGSCRGDVGDSVFGDAGTDLIILAGDNAADHYNVGPGEIEGVSFVTKDLKPGGGFLDVPI